jgi:hypothetical protein
LKLLPGLVHQEHGPILQLEKIANNRKDAVQHLIQIKRRQDCLTGVIQNSYLLHRLEQDEPFSMTKILDHAAPGGMTSRLPEGDVSTLPGNLKR